MKKDLTEIAFILDRSGSMQPLTEEAISAFNSFLQDQQQGPGAAHLTLVLFDDEYLKPADGIPIEDVLPLDTNTYVPRASTALLDAIGRTIDELGVRLSAMPEHDRAATVIVAIFMDGLENASREHTWASVSDRIKQQTEVYKWEFLFLGANQDAIATAANLNIDRRNSATYAADGIGLRASTAAVSKKSYALRARAAGRASAVKLDAIEENLADTVNEEDRKRRS